MSAEYGFFSLGIPCNIFLGFIILFNIHENTGSIHTEFHLSVHYRRFYIMCNSCCNNNDRSGSGCGCGCDRRCDCGCNSNGWLWLLILAFVLSGRNFCLENLFSGCGWPILIALLFCWCRNGSLANIVNNLCGGCGC